METCLKYMHVMVGLTEDFTVLMPQSCSYVTGVSLSEMNVQPGVIFVTKDKQFSLFFYHYYSGIAAITISNSEAC